MLKIGKLDMVSMLIAYRNENMKIFGAKPLEF